MPGITNWLVTSLKRRSPSYYRRAGGSCKLSAHEEAIGYSEKGLELIPALPNNAERNRQELTLLVALGPPLFAAKGYAAPEVERTYSRARELCGQVEETAQLLPVLSGLCGYYTVRPDYQKLRELGEEFLERSQRAQDPAYQAAALFMLGGDATWQGELESAREYLKRSIDLSGSEQCRNLISTLNMEPGIWSFTYLAYVLWLLGYPDQGLKRTQEVLALAHDLDNPFILAYTFCVSGVHHYFRQEEQIVREQAEAAIALSTEYGFAQWMAQGGILRGWALVQQGEGGEEHCAKMHQAMDAWRATGADVGRPYYLLLLAQTHEKLGQIEEGLDLLTEALALTENNREYWLMAELYRVKGELLLAQSKDISADEVEDCFHQAIKFARQQDAKSLELRAVMSLSRLWQKSGKREQARQMLKRSTVGSRKDSIRQTCRKPNSCLESSHAARRDRERLSRQIDVLGAVGCSRRSGGDAPAPGMVRALRASRDIWVGAGFVLVGLVLTFVVAIEISLERIWFSDRVMNLAGYNSYGHYVAAFVLVIGIACLVAPKRRRR